MSCRAAASGASAGSVLGLLLRIGREPAASSCPSSQCAIFAGSALLHLGLALLAFGCSWRLIRRLLVGHGALHRPADQQAARRARVSGGGAGSALPCCPPMKRAKTHDRALLQRVLVDLAVLDDPASDAATGIAGRAALQRDETAAQLVELLVGGLRVLQDAFDVGIDRRLGPRAGDDDRHAEPGEVGLAALPFEARHHLRIDAELERPAREIDRRRRPSCAPAGPARCRSAVCAWPLAILKLAPSAAKSVFSSPLSCQPDEDAGGEAAHRLGDIDAADRAVGELELRRAGKRLRRWRAGSRRSW